MTKSYFFYGVIEGEDMDETWRVLHDHFEKLEKEDRLTNYNKSVSTERKAVKKEGVRD